MVASLVLAGRGYQRDEAAEEGERVEDELGLAGGPGPASFDSGLAALALRSGCAGAVRDLARGGQAQAQTAIALPADSPAAEVPV